MSHYYYRRGSQLTNLSSKKAHFSIDNVLRRSVTEKALKSLVTDFNKNFTVKSLSLPEINFLHSQGLVDAVDVSKFLASANMVEVATLFISGPSQEIYDVLKSKMSAVDFHYMLYEYPAVMDSYVDHSKFNSKDMREYIGGHLSNGSMTKTVARKFLNRIGDFKNKTEVRAMIYSTFKYMTANDVKNMAGLTMKEFLSLFAQLHARKKPSRIIFDRDLLEFMEKKLFLETLKGKSTTSRYQDKNLDLVRKLVEQYEEQPAASETTT